jgi:hypothetical protein
MIERTYQEASLNVSIMLYQICTSAVVMELKCVVKIQGN